MNIAVIAVIIFIISLLLAIRDINRELSVPKSVANLKIGKKKALSGVILFLKKKIIHYSSGSS